MSELNNSEKHDKSLICSPATLELIMNAEAMELEDAKQAGALGFIARAMIIATLPHRDPGDIPVWGRTNGDFSLLIQPGYKADKKTDEMVCVGFPYGTKPRLFMAWISTEAVRTQSRTLEMGDSLSDFMREVGYSGSLSGGKNGSMTLMRDQMVRTLSARFQWSYNEQKRDTGGGLQIADKYDICWLPQKAEQAGLWQSTIELSEKFFDEIKNNPVPIDMRAIRSLRSSPLCLDIYTWLTYRNSYLSRPTQIPWISLMKQFGAGYRDVKQFKFQFEQAMRKVLTVYSTARVEFSTDALILKPSPTHVPMTSKTVKKLVE